MKYVSLRLNTPDPRNQSNSTSGEMDSQPLRRFWKTMPSLALRTEHQNAVRLAAAAEALRGTWSCPSGRCVATCAIVG